MKKLAVLFALMALVPFALAACGGDDDDDGGDTSAETTTEETTADEGGDTGGGTVAIAAAEDGGLEFDSTELTATAGPNTFEFSNPASVGHDFCIESDGSEVGCTETITGSEDTLEADLDAGDYTFYCSVPGHREGGMEGALTVE